MIWRIDAKISSMEGSFAVLGLAIYDSPME
jgi:hypothetical protein